MTSATPAPAPPRSERSAAPGPGYRTLRFGYGMRQGVDWNDIMTTTNTIHALVEVDVTDARKAIHEQRRKSGAPLSFTAFVLASFARAIAEDPRVQGRRKGRSKLVVFDDVDVAVLIEHTVDGELVPVPYVVREANRKDPAAIDAEIRAARNGVAPYAGALRFARPWLLLPSALRRFILRRVLADPHRRRRLTGTAAVTALSMFGRGTGWGVPFISHPICLTVGGIGRRPAVTSDGGIAPRELVCLTLSVDHDVVNGAPLARFISRMRESIESAAILG